MAFTNSPLATYTRISPNRNSPRNQPITKITIHHQAGINSVEGFGNIVASPARGMSANYAIGNDGRIGLFCPEGDRSWCSSSPWNDHRAITIEVSNSAYGDSTGWPISNAAYNSLIKLCVDICKRNGIPKLVFTGDKNGSLTYHYMFSATACLPIDRTELLTPNGWKLLKDIKIGDKVASVHVDNLGIFFDDVENMVPVKTQDTYTIRDLEATSDHRIMYFNQAGRQYVSQFKDIYDTSCNLYIPNAGYTATSTRLPISDDEMEFLVAVQADGHYMKDGECRYGIEFHFSKERKIKRVKKLLNRLEIEYKICEQTNGTTKIRIYGKRYVKFCEDFLNEKRFTWDWLNMSNAQASHFLDVVLEYDGCRENLSYSSSIKSNVDIVQAIAATHGVGSKLADNGMRVYFKKEKRSLGECKKKRNPRQQVSCVTVRSGFILIRQHGRTTVVGNCPGPWIKAHTQDICNKVNAQLANVKPAPTVPEGKYTVNLSANAAIYNAAGGKKIGSVNIATKYTITEDKKVGYITYGKLKSGAGWVVVKDETPKPTPKPSTSSFKTGDLVSIKSGAKYYNGGGIPNWVSAEKWYISSISGDRAVLGLNERKNRNIQSPINTKDITLVTAKVNTYTKSLKASDLLYSSAGGRIIGTVGATGVFTIVEDKNINGVVYGKLKSGAGWVICYNNSTIKVGDYVKVINPIIYGTTRKFTVFVDKYKVLEVKGDRIVISSDGKNVTSAIAKINVQKI